MTRKRLVCGLVLAVLLAVGAAPVKLARAEASESTVVRIGAGTFDLIVLRPLGFGQMAVGSGFLAIAWPFSYFSGHLEDIVEQAVTEPFEYTFTRALGDF